jgi:hypothetical protein
MYRRRVGLKALPCFEVPRHKGEIFVKFLCVAMIIHIHLPKVRNVFMARFRLVLARLFFFFLDTLSSKVIKKINCNVTKCIKCAIFMALPSSNLHV